MTSQSVRIGSLELKNPVLTASGTFGYGVEWSDFYDVAELGGICTKGLSLLPRAGNPPERICETPAGMLNAIGLANIGVEAFCSEKLPALQARGVTVIPNIFATSAEDFAKLASRLDREPGVHALELNVSCPNVKSGGIQFGMDPALCARLTRAVREVTSKPVWVKMSPEAPDVVAVARACEEAGAEAITAINTIRGMAIDPQTMTVRLGNRIGGLSGPAIRPIGVRIVWDLVGALRIPVVGIGGIATADDALEYLLAGASAVQVGTANFADPAAAHHVARGIREYCAARELSVEQLIGRARPDPE